MKKIHDTPKTAYQRLLESDDVDERVKHALKQQAKGIHIVKQKRCVDKAVAKLLYLYAQKKQQQLPVQEQSS